MLDLSKLKEEMPYKWKANNKMGNKMACVAYVDARQVEDKLDAVCGPENWQDDFKIINGNLYGGIGVNVTGDSNNPKWVWKWDCGTESKTEKEKGESSDSFKRASVKWGIGRFLYNLEIQRLNMGTYNGKNYPADENGKIFFDNKQLTNYINNKINKIESDKTDKTNKKDDTKSDNSSNKNKSGKYSDKSGNDVKYQKTHSYSNNVINKVSSLKRDGKEGKAVLTNYIEDYNKQNNTSYKIVSEFDTDEKLLSLINFIEEQPPKSI